LRFNSVASDVLPTFLGFGAELIRRGVIPILAATNTTINLDSNTTAQIVNTTILVETYYGAVIGYVETAQTIACLAPTLLIGMNLVLFLLVLFGQGIAIAGCLIVIVGLMRSKYSLATAGFVVIATGAILALICFAVSTPLSVVIDDTCYTVNTLLNESRVGQFLLNCMDNNVVRNAAASFIEITQILFTTQLVPTLQNSSIPVPFLPEINTTNITAYPGTNNELLQVFLNQTQQKIDFLQSINTTSVASNLSDVIFVGIAFLRSSEVLATVLQVIGDCGLPIFRTWMASLNNLVCQGLPTGLGMVVWGIFAAGVTMMLAAICMVSGVSLMDGNQIRNRIVHSMTVMTSILALGNLVVALMATYSTIQEGYSAFFYVLFALFLVSFVLLAISRRVYFKISESFIRWVWIAHLVVSVIVIALSCAGLGIVAPQLTDCLLRNSSSCQYQCSNSQIAYFVVEVVWSALNLVGALVLAFFGIWLGIVKPPKRNFFTKNEAEKDWERMEVPMDSLKPADLEEKI
jgi:hypothetical protein